MPRARSRARAAATRTASPPPRFPTAGAPRHRPPGPRPEGWRVGRTVPPRFRLSHDDAADDLSGFHRAERIVDLVELDPAAHHGPDIKATGLDEVDVALEVAAVLRRPVQAEPPRISAEHPSHHK